MKLILFDFWLFLIEISDLIADIVFGKEKKQEMIQFGCDPDSDNNYYGCSHIYNKESGLIDVIYKGNIVANYEIN